MQENEQRLLPQAQIERHQPVMSVVGEDDDIHPEQLSGDENDAQKTKSRSNISHSDEHKANFSLTVATIIKSIIGTGIISMPYTVKLLGWGLSVILFVGAGVLNQFGSVLLLKAKNLSRHSNFNTIFYEIWRSRIAKAVGSLAILLNNMGICIIIMIIFKQAIRHLLEELGHPQEDQGYPFGKSAVAALALLELCFAFVKKIQRLKVIAFLGAIGVLSFALSFFIFFMQSRSDSEPQRQPVGDMNTWPLSECWSEAVGAIPNLMLTFGFQMNFYPIFKGMKKANDRKMSRAVGAGIVFCTLIYLLIGILGYDYYGNVTDQKAKNNFLLNLRASGPKDMGAYFYVTTCSFLFSISCAFPIMFFACRNNFIAIVQLFMTEQNEQDVSQGLQPQSIMHIDSQLNSNNKDTEGAKKRKAVLRFRLLTLAIFLAIVGVAMFRDQSEEVFNIIGALSAFPISIILPCFFYFKLVQIKNQPRKIQYYIAVSLFVFMIPFAIFSIVAFYLDPDKQCPLK